MKRSDFLRSIGLLTASSLLSPRLSALNTWQPAKINEFSLPELLYSYDALNSVIDAQTMEIHHKKHHQAYISNLNKAVIGTPAEGLGLLDILKNVSKYPMAVRNNAGGHFNHSLFWTILTPSPKKTVPTGKLAKAIKKQFGSFTDFKKIVEESAKNRFGSGWVWLLVDAKGRLEVGSSPNQDNPLMDISPLKGEPILGLDVWEHAYYLRYQNRRTDYAAAIWQIINWEEVARRYALATKNKG